MISYRRFRQVNARGNDARPAAIGSVENDPGTGVIGSDTNCSSLGPRAVNALLLYLTGIIR